MKNFIHGKHGRHGKEEKESINPIDMKLQSHLHPRRSVSICG